MSALISAIAAILFFVFSCGQQENPSQESNLAMLKSNGRLTCTGFTAPSGNQENISGCTESNVLAASSPNYSMNVVKNRNDLSISLRNRRTGDIWNGEATLKFPTGGTGTRARAFVNQPMFAMMSCEIDTLLSCRPQ